MPPPQGPIISSPTHPDQERWYQDANPTFVWQGSGFADGYSFSADQNPSGVPDTTAETNESTVSFQNMKNGIWYFHLRERAASTWGGVSHYVAKIDADAPASFQAIVAPGRRTTERNPIFRFFTTDALSGLDHFEMKVIPLSHDPSEALFFEVTSPYQAPNFEPGRYQIVIRAVDGAGNTRDENVTMTITTIIGNFIDQEGMNLGFIFLPWKWLLDMILVALILMLMMILVLWRKHRHHVTHAFREDISRVLYWNKKQKRRTPSAFLLIFLSSCIIAIFWFDIVRAQTSSPSLPQAPLISVAPIRYYPLDEWLYLEGTAPATVPIELYFERIAGGAQPLRIRVQTNTNGEWYFGERLELASGEWTVRARVATDPPSDWSNPRIIKSVVSGVVFGWIKIRYLPLALGLVAILATACALLCYAYVRVRRVRRMEQDREMEEKTRVLEERIRQKDRETAGLIVEQNFSDLRRKITAELDHLHAKMSEGTQTTEEREHQERLLRELAEAEEEIEKKIKDTAEQ